MSKDHAKRGKGERPDKKAKADLNGKTARLNVEIPLALRIRVKAWCAAEDREIKDVIREVLEKHFPRFPEPGQGGERINENYRLREVTVPSGDEYAQFLARTGEKKGKFKPGDTCLFVLDCDGNFCTAVATKAEACQYVERLEREQAIRTRAAELLKPLVPRLIAKLSKQFKDLDRANALRVLREEFNNPRLEEFIRRDEQA
jgi:hypothetical protein